ncbi:hypothetical protein [Roseomonas xinghualingensis]|uniref:hypothetical protein n=1 Tax=Roseomonas xinghualingensis TaxID=2986475 RepID=UPI00367005DE
MSIHTGRELAAAVISLAFADLGAAEDIPGGMAAARPTPNEKDNAIRFLTDREGEWAEARECWADAAGIEPDVLREKALRALAGLPLYPKPKPVVEVVGHIVAVRPSLPRYIFPDRSTCNTVIRKERPLPKPVPAPLSRDFDAVEQAAREGLTERQTAIRLRLTEKRVEKVRAKLVALGRLEKRGRGMPRGTRLMNFAGADVRASFEQGEGEVAASPVHQSCKLGEPSLHVPEHGEGRVQDVGEVVQRIGWHG